MTDLTDVLKVILEEELPETVEGYTWVPTDLDQRPLTGLARMIITYLFYCEQHGNKDEPCTMDMLYRHFAYDSKRQVQKAVQKLKELGMLEIIKV